VPVRFLADEDLDASIIRGLHSREPAIDILDVKTAGLRETADSEMLLVLSAWRGRGSYFGDAIRIPTGNCGASDFCLVGVGTMATTSVTRRKFLLTDPVCQRSPDNVAV
jgi:hypothetical protein